MHIIRDADENITTEWYSADRLGGPGDYTLSGNGTLDGGTLMLQLGVKGADGTVVACADDHDLTVDATTPPVVVTITKDMLVRGKLSDAGGSAAGVNLWLA